jgi:ligand-binding sensor domain-containing protein
MLHMIGRRESTRAALWSLSLLIASAVQALDPQLGPDQYVSRMWTVADGLPQNGVLVVAQGEGGYLYLGTQAGLARFDGVRFVVFDKSSEAPFEDHFITSLAARPGAGLWVGTRDGLLFMDGSHGAPASDTRRWSMVEGLPEAYVRSLLPARDGALWIGSYGGGLVRRAGDRTEVFGVAEGLPDPFVRVLLEDAEGGSGPAHRRDWRVSGTAFSKSLEPLGVCALWALLRMELSWSVPRAASWPGETDARVSWGYPMACPPTESTR